jgi:hypothetical protein
MQTPLTQCIPPRKDPRTSVSVSSGGGGANGIACTPPQRQWRSIFSSFPPNVVPAAVGIGGGGNRNRPSDEEAGRIPRLVTRRDPSKLTVGYCCSVVEHQRRKERAARNDPSGQPVGVRPAPNSKAGRGNSRRLLGHTSTLPRLPLLLRPRLHHGELSFGPLFDERLQRFRGSPVVLLGRRRDQVTAPGPFGGPMNRDGRRSQ